MSRANRESEVEDPETPGTHPTPADLERLMRCELEDAEHRAVAGHLLEGCEKCRSITTRLWNHGAREPLSLVEMLASPKTLVRRRRRARTKKWDPRMSAAVVSLESVAREILKDYVTELEGLRDRLEILAAVLSRVPVEDPEKVSSGERLHAAITCVLQDTLQPAIDGLSAAAHPMAEPDDEEAEETA